MRIEHVCIADQLDASPLDRLLDFLAGKRVRHSSSIGRDFFVTFVADGPHFRCIFPWMLDEQPQAWRKSFDDLDQCRFLFLGRRLVTAQSSRAV